MESVPPAPPDLSAWLVIYLPHSESKEACKVSGVLTKLYCFLLKTIYNRLTSLQVREIKCSQRAAESSGPTNKLWKVSKEDGDISGKANNLHLPSIQKILQNIYFFK